MMNEEKEKKVEIHDADSNQVLEHFTRHYGQPCCERIVDTYYDYQSHKLFELNHSIRIRETRYSEHINYKALFYIPNRKDDPWFVLEFERELPAGKDDLQPLSDILEVPFPYLHSKKDFHTFMEKNDFEPIMRLDKERYTFSLESDTNILIDEVDQLGVFCEIEYTDGSECQRILDKIPFRTTGVRFGYTNMYAARILGKNIQDLREKYINDPAWNILKNEERYLPTP